MAMTPEVKARLLIATREAAAAFLEDMTYLREVLKRPDPVRGELRRLSNELRRLLVDNGGDLPGIAAPRIGRLMFQAPDNNPYYRAERGHALSYFASGSSLFFGISVRGFMMFSGKSPRMEQFDPEHTVDLPLDRFLSQRLICLSGRWINRRQIIKYVANTASGVHSGTPQEEADKLLARIRQCVSYSVQNGSFHLDFNVDAFNPKVPDIPFKHQPNAVDPVLIELLATAHFVTTSPRVLELETVVRDELSKFS